MRLGPTITYQLFYSTIAKNMHGIQVLSNIIKYSVIVNVNNHVSCNMNISLLFLINWKIISINLSVLWLTIALEIDATYCQLLLKVTTMLSRLAVNFKGKSGLRKASVSNRIRNELLQFPMQWRKILDIWDFSKLSHSKHTLLYSRKTQFHQNSLFCTRKKLSHFVTHSFVPKLSLLLIVHTTQTIVNRS